MNKYSIILPVRNGGHYVKDCVNSILSQTLSDFNLLVLDNCSTDGTREWIESLNDIRIVLYPADRPLSIEENWARITTIPKNEFITLIGHDDLLYPDFLATIDALQRANPSASLYHTHFDFIDAKGKRIRTCKPMPAALSTEQLLEGFLVNRYDSMGTGYVMRAADYDAIGGIPARYPKLLFADFELWLLMTKLGFESIAAPCCFAFRVHDSTTGQAADRTLHEALGIYVDFLRSFVAENPSLKTVLQSNGAAMLHFYCKGYAHRLLRTPFENRSSLTVSNYVGQVKMLASRLGVNSSFHPEKDRSVWLAMQIDKYPILRKLFLLFKKVYKKPVL